MKIILLLVQLVCLARHRFYIDIFTYQVLNARGLPNVM